MSRKPQAEPAITLLDSDIRSARVVSRRSLLGVLGVGVAAGAILGTTGNAPAADSDTGKKAKSKKGASKQPPPKKDAPKKGKKEESDSD